MSILAWDNVGEKQYETGIDKGVLYLADGSAVPWNGLVSVVEHIDRTTTPIYYDGRKVSDITEAGSFSASMKAVTYPDEFIEFEGSLMLMPGVYIADQEAKRFNLSYRTRIGNDLNGSNVGYKIHVLYNLIAIPSDKTFLTETANAQFTEFEWKISAVPEDIPGFRPTAHIVINSLEFNPLFLAELELILYGDSSTPAKLIPLSALITRIRESHLVTITDNGDGTWSASSVVAGYVNLTTIDTFELDNVNVVYPNINTFNISDTL